MKTKLVVFGLAIAVAGASLAALGLLGLTEANSSAELLQKARAAELPEFGWDSIEDWKTSFILTSLSYFAAGTLMLVGGGGAALVKRWARPIALAGIGIMLAAQAYVVLISKANSTENIVELLIWAAALAITGWGLFRSKLAKHFAQDAQQGAPGDGPRPAGSARA